MTIPFLAAQELSAAIPDAKDQLESARVYAQKAESELDGSQRDKEAAQRALNAIAVREELLDVADQRMKEDIAAKQGIDAVNEAWSCIQEGNALLTQAATCCFGHNGGQRGEINRVHHFCPGSILKGEGMHCEGEGLLSRGEFRCLAGLCQQANRCDQ